MSNHEIATSELGARTDGTAAVIDTAVASVGPTSIGDGLHVVVTPPGSVSEVLDERDYRPVLERRTGTYALHTAGSFSRYVAEHTGPTSEVYADAKAFTVTAVFDDHLPGAENDKPGWRQYRARLAMAKTDAWLRWEKVDGQWLKQSDFAELIEAGAPDIQQPDAAAMLDLAQTFSAKTDVTFRSARQLQSGERQLVYSETIDASAGSGGDISIPKELVLGVVPFEGSGAYRVTARFRYRINNGALLLGILLLRPEDVLRAAFTEAVSEIEDATDVGGIYFGSAPA